MAISVESIADWRGRDVLDPENNKIGKLSDIYVDTATDEPVFALVKIGLLTSQRHAFVPLEGASVGPNHVRVRYASKDVKKAPAIDSDGELPAEAEVDVYNHYSLPYRAPDTPAGRRLARR